MHLLKYSKVCTWVPFWNAALHWWTASASVCALGEDEALQIVTVKKVPLNTSMQSKHDSFLLLLAELAGAAKSVHCNTRLGARGLCFPQMEIFPLVLCCLIVDLFSNHLPQIAAGAHHFIALHGHPRGRCYFSTQHGCPKWINLGGLNLKYILIKLEAFVHKCRTIFFTFREDERGKMSI